MALQIDKLEFKVYNVYVSFPDPFSAWELKIPLSTGDILSGKGFIESYKMFHAEMSKKRESEIVSLFDLRRLSKQKVDIAHIIHSGIGRSSQMVISIQTMPSGLYSTVSRLKYNIYSYLYNNAIIIKSRPENFYLLSGKRLSELSRIKRDVDEEIERVNDYSEEIWETEVKPKLYELLEKFNVLDKYSKRYWKPEIKKLRSTRTIITPIVFENKTLGELLVTDPEAERMLRESMKEYITNMLMSVHEKMHGVLESIITGRNVRVDMARAKINRITAIFDEVGLNVIGNRVRAEYQKILAEPWRYKNYVKWEALAKEMNARILSL